jgi:hypothetical protein
MRSFTAWMMCVLLIPYLSSSASGGPERGISQTAFRVMILNNDDTSAGILRGPQDRCSIDGLYRISVDHPDGNAFGLQLRCRCQRFVHRDPGTDNSHTVVDGFAQDFGSTYRERFVIGV